MFGGLHGNYHQQIYIFIKLSNSLNSLCVEIFHRMLSPINPRKINIPYRFKFFHSLSIIKAVWAGFCLFIYYDVFQRPAMMSVEKGYFYTDASCLVTEYCKHGSVLVGTHSPSIKYWGDTHNPSIKYWGYTESECEILGVHRVKYSLSIKYWGFIQS